jgi:hypothetical protein
VRGLESFRASDASRYVTGRSIVVGGRNILQEYKSSSV